MSVDENMVLHRVWDETAFGGMCVVSPMEAKLNTMNRNLNVLLQGFGAV
jgi:hypothetical protein